MVVGLGPIFCPPELLVCVANGEDEKESVCGSWYEAKEFWFVYAEDVLEP